MGGSLGGASAPGAGPFREANGIVVVEIESLPMATGWEKKTQAAGYKGSGYYEWTVAGTSAAGRGVIPLEFQVTTPGRYEIVWRNQEGPGAEDLANDSWMRLLTGTEVMDTGQDPLATNWTKVFHNGGKAVWDYQTTAEPVHGKFRPVRRDYAAGLHRIEIAGRSQAHAIDRIVIYKYEGGPAVSTFDSLSESPRAP